MAAVLASTFDILFAVNRQLHPGEKGLIEHVERHCIHQPRRMNEHAQGRLTSAGPGEGVLDSLDDLVDGRDELHR